MAANQGTEEEPGTTVSIIDTATFSVVGDVETGKGAHGVVVDPSSRHAYITNIYGRDVAVVDLVDRTMVATIPVGAEPNGISFSSLAPAAAPAAEMEMMMPAGTEDMAGDEDMEDH